MGAAAVAVTEQGVFALTRVELVERAEVFGCVLARADKILNACDRCSIGAFVVGDPLAVCVQRVDVVLCCLIGAGGTDTA